MRIEFSSLPVSVMLFLLLGLVMHPQQLTNSETITKLKQQTSAPAHLSKFTEYRGVRIGMTADEARQKLGKPKNKDNSQDLYVLSDSESAQVFYDGKGSVYAISIDYSGKDKAAPAPVDVFGHDIPPKPDGSVYQLQQYPENGYWVSYNRTTGESPLVSITIQKLSSDRQ